MSWGRRRYDWGRWPRYVPVAERREKARKQAEKLRKKGGSLSPVILAGRTIAATFWGKAWCQNLERYRDYENRIPRGRAYVRNGSVLDLKIGAARVDALVSGTHLYSVTVEIRPLKAQVWKEVKKACTGRIGSLLELLQGKLSREVMEIVTRPQTGLFPEPAEISFRCSCPDWASMCKHVAAVFYGIGARLDREPDLLFRLRDVDHRELIAAPDAADLAASPGMGVKTIAEEDLAGIFDIEIDEGQTAGQRVTRTTPKPGKSVKIRAVSIEAVAPKEDHAPGSAITGGTQAQTRNQRTFKSKEQEAATPSEPLKRKLGRPRLVRQDVSLPKPHRGRPPLVRKGPTTTQQARKSFAISEKQATGRKPSRKSRPMPPTQSPEPAKPRRSRPPKAAAAAVSPSAPPKRKRGRPPGGGNARHETKERDGQP